MNSDFKMQMEFLQPWSTFVMKTQLPPEVHQKMLKITDKIIENEESPKTDHRIIVDEFIIDKETLKQEELLLFFSDVSRHFVIQQFLQMYPGEEERKKILDDDWYIDITSGWTVSQKDNEYQPFHFHPGSAVSMVMYLKIPEYLPREYSKWEDYDGSICFFHNNAGNKSDWKLPSIHQPWGASSMILKPQLGDFYIFPSSLDHLVYPFRTVNGKGERRSVSLNAIFSNKDKIKKQ